MQRYCTELTERLLKSLDKEYNVVDMGAVVDVITALEKTTITKEVLEITRLGKYINELRRKTSNDALAKRAKDLVRRWRDMVLPSSHATPQPTLADTAPQALNGTKPQSPALRGLKPHSPALRGLKPQSPALKNLKPHSPLMRDTNPYKVLSPALSLHSDHSRSPNPTPTKHHHNQQPSLVHAAPTTRTTNTTNNRLNSNVSPKIVLPTTQNHPQIEAVPRTHSSNKRLRKDDQNPFFTTENTPPFTSNTSVKSSRSDSNDSLASRLEPQSKRPRLNGETSNNDFSSKSTESYVIINNNVVGNRSTSNVASRTSTSNQQVPNTRENEKLTIERLSPDVGTYVECSPDVSDTTTLTGPKKRGRKKGSKSLKNQILPEDRVKEKLASISRNPKLKTTQELLADLQARGSNFVGSTTTTSSTTIDGSTNLKVENSRNEEISRNSGIEDRPLSSRFLRSGRDKTSSLRSSNFTETSKFRTKINATGKCWENSTIIDDVDESPTEDDAEISKFGNDLTVEQILAKLPPLDVDAISWSDDEVESREDEENFRKPDVVEEITEENVDRLHGECVEGLNGNFQVKLKISGKDEEIGTIDATKDGRNDDVRITEDFGIVETKIKNFRRCLGNNEDDREFREWHEMLAKPSYEGQTLHILPYVIID